MYKSAKNQALTVGANRNKTVTANEVSSIGGNRQKLSAKMALITLVSVR